MARALSSIVDKFRGFNVKVYSQTTVSVTQRELERPASEASELYQ